ncbi:hypothetical protein PHMEG_0001750 [Phytophthora megakarya]|uniref:Uncharacterized protein n=1 Tax=Phytophthora megakarya TaxID=4795 RepID=A0A225X2G3_9STRA|nr:hypothetical protein PHMEG_0001750 [Phytophthora megakarya]
MDDAPVAAQISQADIIERQAENIARLKRQVQKGNEYKQLTKSKLKEAAARLKEYRLRVETTLNQVKPKRHVRHAATQTLEKSTVTRTCQTQLSGNVEQGNKRIMVDSGVQTVDVVEDTMPSRKRHRGQVASTETEMDQLVPKLSRGSETLKDIKTSTSTVWSLQEPLQNVGDANFHETSAALDAELAFSDSDESGGTGDMLEIGSGVEGAKLGEASSGLLAFDLAVSSEIDKELEFSSDEEERTGTDMKTSETDASTDRAVTQTTVNNDSSSTSLVGINQAAQNEIDKKLASNNEDEDHSVSRQIGEAADKITRIESRIGSSNAARDKSGGSLRSGGLDQAICNEIDKDLETSSNDNDTNQGEKIYTNMKEVAERVLGNGVIENIDDTSQNKQTLMSIDDELDDEFAALEADSDSLHDEKPANGTKSSSSSSSSSTSDSETDSDEGGDEGDTADGTLNGVRSAKLSSPKHPTPFVIRRDEGNGVGQEVDASTVDTRQPVVFPQVILKETSDVPTIGALPRAEEVFSRLILKETRQVPTSAQDVETLPPAEEDSPQKIRNAEEANLGDSQITPSKKPKLDNTSKRTDDEGISTPTGSSKVKNKPAAPVETKEERRMKNSLALFKKTIMLSKGEEADVTYARRTLTLLVSQCSRVIDSHPTHVLTLCQILVDMYLTLKISPISVVRGALTIFRATRSRRLMQETKWGLSWLCNQVLIRLMCFGDTSLKQNVLTVSESLTMSLVDECLQYLQGLLIEERKHIGDCLLVNKIQMQAQVATQHINRSHDKAFLAQICALHTHLCKSSGQLSRSRVLLFDIVRANPDIKGLYFAMVMVEIYPGILERSFDQECMERQMILKTTLQQAFVVLSGVASTRNELLLHLPSMMMLHRIADAIQMPELDQVDGTDPHLPKTNVEKLFDEFKASCQATSQDVSSTEFFAVAKSLEICTAVYGLDLIVQIFSIERCQKLFANANVESKRGIISVVGHIAMIIANDTASRSEQYLESVVDWFYELLLTKVTDMSTDDHLNMLVTCSTVCVELILEYSASIGLDARRRALCAIVKWFDTIPSDQLIDLSASFLRRLRLAVVAARPHMMPAVV